MGNIKEVKYGTGEIDHGGHQTLFSGFEVSFNKDMDDGDLEYFSSIEHLEVHKLNKKNTVFFIFKGVPNGFAFQQGEAYDKFISDIEEYFNNKS